MLLNAIELLPSAAYMQHSLSRSHCDAGATIRRIVHATKGKGAIDGGTAKCLPPVRAPRTLRYQRLEPENG